MTAAWHGENYDRSSDPQAHWGSDVVARMPADLRGLVVDAGCGSGRVTEQLLERIPGASILGLDASASMIAAASARLARYGDRISLHVHDLLEPLQLPELASAIFSTGTFHWLHDHTALYRAMRAATLPNGLLVAQAGGRGSLDEVMDIIRGMNKELAELNYYASVSETTASLKASGYEPINVWLNEENVQFDSRAAVAQFLTDAALGPHLELVDTNERCEFVKQIVDALMGPRLQFVRLNIIARVTP